MFFEIDPSIIPPKYLPYLFDDTRYMVLFGGRGSAKSSFAYRKYVLRCFKNEYFKCGYVRKHFSDIRDSMFAGIKNAIKDLGLEDNFKIYESDYRIVCTNGNSFIPKGCDDPEKTKGLEECSHLLIDEITELEEKDFTTLNELLRTSRTKTQTLVMFNPIMETHWVRKFFFHPDDRFSPNPAFGENIKIVHSTLWDNNFINREDYHRDLLLSAAGNENRIRVNIKGDWGLPENDAPWLYSFDETKHVKDKLPYLRTWYVYLSFDFNREPVTCVAFQKSPSIGMPDSFLHFLKEFGGNYQLKELCTRIRAFFPGAIFFVTGDRTGKNGNVGFEQRHATYYTMIQKYLRLTDKQMHIEGKNMEHNDSRNLINTLLYNMPKIYISKEGCPNTIQDCLLAQVDDKSNTPGKIKKDRDMFKMDYFDCFRYPFQTYYADYANKVYLLGK